MHLRKVVECCFKLKKNTVSKYCREESLPVLCDPWVQESQFQFDLNIDSMRESVYPVCGYPTDIIHHTELELSFQASLLSF